MGKEKWLKFPCGIYTTDIAKYQKYIWKHRSLQHQLFLRSSWSYILELIFLTDHTIKKDFSEVWFLCYSGTDGRTWAPQELCWNNLKQHFPPKLFMHLQAPCCNSPGACGYRCDYEGTKLAFSCFLSHAQSCVREEES